MDKGVEFVIKNFQNAISICERDPRYKSVLRRIKIEYSRIKSIPYTGNMIDYFDKFSNKKHKYAEDFAFLSHYNILTNEKIAGYLREHFQDEINHRKEIKDLLIGEALTTGELMVIFGVKYRGSVRKSNAKNLVVIISDRKKGYNKIDNNNVINYLAAENNFQYRENKSVLNYRKNNTRLYMFETYGNNKYYFFGEIEFARDPFFNENNQAIFPFKLKEKQKTIIDNEVDKVDGIPTNYKDFWCLQLITESTIEKAINLPVIKGSTSFNKQKTNNSSSDRERSVIAYVKHRASGVCDLCGKKAPFISKEGVPFLECHHVIQIADDGPDRVYNAVALCPNCHRKMHNLKLDADKSVLVSKIENYLKKEGNLDNIKAFNKLFSK